MQIQQMRPMRMGLPPVFTSFTTSVFRPMAAMAMTMKNLLRVFRRREAAAASASGGTATVVMTEASTGRAG